jgi:UDP:flavonoid glycosyltransferase YjiC (YdhE family)
MLLTRFSEHIPRRLPPGVAHFDYVPFRPLLPRAAAVIHHGGIGSTAQGLAAGIPQLLMPLAHDEFDNAARVKSLGIGSEVRPNCFCAKAVARELEDLLGSPAVRRACVELAERCQPARGIVLTADALERVA